jgi:general secretion pathway protein K
MMNDAWRRLNGRRDAWVVRHSAVGAQHGRGSALVYVVWVVMLLSVLAASVGAQSLSSLGVAERLTQQLQAAYLARAAVQVAADALQDDLTPHLDTLDEPWTNSLARFERYALGPGSFQVLGEGPTPAEPWYGLTDEERRLNLNTAPVEALRRLLELAGGLAQDEALVAAESIADWRDEDDEARSFGAERDYYRSRRPTYDCKDGPFENLEELLLVRGMTEAVYRRVAPHLTVWGSGQVNLNTASPTTLRALGLSEVGVSGLESFRAGDDGTPGTSDDGRLASIVALDAELARAVPAEDLEALRWAVQEKLLDVKSSAFRASILATVQEPIGHLHVMCVLARDGTIQFWSER